MVEMDDRFSEEELVLPLIDARICTGCGECVAVCPTGALALVEGRSSILHPELCTYCAACEEQCSKGGIGCPYEVIFEP